MINCHLYAILCVQMVGWLGPLPADLALHSALGRQVDLTQLSTITTSSSMQHKSPPIQQQLRKIDPGVADLVTGLLAYKPVARLTAKEVDRHECLPPGIKFAEGFLDGLPFP
jgi:hypothetical protein